MSGFSDNQWGYSYSTDGEANWISGSQGSTTSGYNGLPLDGNDSGATGIALVDTTTPLAINQVKFKIGAKASNTQASGTYTNTINFYAITHQAPLTFDDAFAAAGKTKYLGYYTMQDMTHNICVNTEQGFNTKLIDIRDNEIYTIAKLKDDNCWMLDNLRLGGDNPLLLTSQDTNMVAETWELPANSTEEQSKSYVTPSLISRYKNNTTTNYGIGSNEIGLFYNYCADSVGAYCYEYGQAQGDNDYDVCPKNWRMPTGGSAGDFKELCDKVTDTDCANSIESAATDPNSLQKNLSVWLTGLYSFIMDSINMHGLRAYYWTSTRKNNYDMFFIRIGSTTVEPVGQDLVWDTRIYGLSVRCLAK